MIQSLAASILAWSEAAILIVPSSLDVDLGAGLGDDLADHLAAGADHFADLVDRDLDGLDLRRVLAQLGAGAVHGLVHLAEDVQAAALSLGERLAS